MANEAEKRRWNDEAWARMWPRREAVTDRITPYLLEALALQPGERVLDVGCGGGKTTIAAARAVGSTGIVLGADLSQPLLELAASRAEAAGVANVQFLQADVQTDKLGDGGYHVATSQFGVMFFDRAVTAFGNIGAHLAPGGRLVFACWQEIGKNPWFPGAVLAPFVPPPPAPAEGTTPTGPFALGDPAWVAEMLTAAGFEAVQIQPVEIVGETTRDALVDDDQLALMGVDPARMDEVREVLDRHVAQFGDPGGTLRIPLAFHLVRARRP